MENIDKYIGIPYKFNGRTRESGCDCLGLCYLFYKEHGWITLDDGKPITKDWREKDPNRLARWFGKHFKVTRDPDELEFGDILLFDVFGDTHLAIYLEYGRVLALQLPTREWSKSTIYHKDSWLHGFKAGFKRCQN